MESVDTHLIRREDGLSLLLTPPFDRMVPTPGYIRGYVPGVRENGGQYTHAALWTVLAFARLGDGDRAMELFAMLNPVNKTRTPDDVARYRAEPVRRRGGRVLEPRAHRPRRVDLVHRLRGVDVSGRDRGAARIDAQSRSPAHRSVHSTHTGRVTRRSSRTLQAELRIVVENPEGVTRGVRLWSSTGRRSHGDVPLLDAVGTHTVRVVLGK